MDKITKLHADREARRKEIGAILKEAETEKRALTDEERAKSAELQKDLEKIEASIHEWQLTAPAIAVADGQGRVVRRQEGAPGASAKYADLFGAVAQDESFPDLATFFEAVASGRHHPALRAAMSEGVGSEGGFLVPTEYSAEAFDVSLETEVVRPRARVYGMKSDVRKIAGFTMDGEAGVGPYGFAASWVAEGGGFTPVTPLVREVDLYARKCGIYLQASNELAADGLSFGQQLSGVLTKALGWALDEAFLNGNGAGKPIGCTVAPCTVVVGKETGQAADTFEAQNALKMYSRLLPGSHRTAVWVVHPSVIPELYTMTVPSGTAGTLLGLVPSYFDAGRMTLLGLPIVVSEKMQSIGDQGDVGLFDFTYYAIGMRREISVDESQHVGFANDLASFRAIARVDGKPLLSQAYQPTNGTDTLSPFVVLEAR